MSKKNNEAAADKTVDAVDDKKVWAAMNVLRAAIEHKAREQVRESGRINPRTPLGMKTLESTCADQACVASMELSNTIVEIFQKYT